MTTAADQHWMQNRQLSKPAMYCGACNAGHCARNADHSAFNADHYARNADHSACNADHCARNAYHSACNADHCARNAVHSACNADHCARNADHSACNADHCARNADHSACNADLLDRFVLSCRSCGASEFVMSSIQLLIMNFDELYLLFIYVVEDNEGLHFWCDAIYSGLEVVTPDYRE